jgi:predicted ribosome quality control (RQC) complex YloA/Tae2 family protein
MEPDPPSSPADEAREGLRRALSRALTRVERRIAAVRADLERIEVARAEAEHARMFVAAAARAPRGARSLAAVDWSSGDERRVELSLDPARGAREQLEAVFRRARRLADGAPVAQARQAEAERLRDTLTGLAADLEEPTADLDALVARAVDAAPRDFRPPGAGPATQEPRTARTKEAGAAEARPPHRTFLGTAGAAILVGRGAAQNDELTTHVAKPRDLWLHVKSRTGAHVVVPLAKGASCPAELLVDAAHLAAHFSEARGESTVEVSYTPRRYIRKPRHSAPGAVVVDREKVLILRVDEARLRRLLERERL